MNIVIVGGGELGRHVATLLSREQHNVILIDTDARILQEVSATADIATRHGSGTDWQLLDDLLEFSPDILLALTSDDETNLVACDIAKHLQYPRTIARVRGNRYLNRARLDFGRIFNVDYFLGPEVLVAHDMLKYIINPGSLANESFAHGALQLRTILIPSTWQAPNTTLRNFNLPPNIIVGLIKRDAAHGDEKVVIFPHGNDTLKPNDEVTFIGETEAVSEIHHLFDIEQKEIRSVVIAGGSLTAIHLATALVQRDLDVRIIDKSFERCTLLAERLPQCTIMHHEATDIDFLRTEKVGQSDILVACTNNDEVNILIGLLGQEIGCPDILVILNSPQYIPIVNRLGFKHVASPRNSATNHILSQLFSGKVSSLISLYENQAEILEITVSMDSKIVGIPLSELGPYLPKDLLIVMIQNRGRIMIAHGNRIISPGDTVIVVTSPQHVDELERIF